MPICERCGLDVRKLTSHAVSGKKICMRCVSDSGCYGAHLGDLIGPEERRASIRLPLAIALEFSMPGSTLALTQRYPGHTVDISMTGLCLAWQPCDTCTGYTARDVHPDCLFFPYSLKSDKPHRFVIELRLAPTTTLKVQVKVAYTLKEESIGAEYLGVQFLDIDNPTRRIIEKIIIAHAPRE